MSVKDIHKVRTSFDILRDAHKVILVGRECLVGDPQVIRGGSLEQRPQCCLRAVNGTTGLLALNQTIHTCHHLLLKTVNQNAIRNAVPMTRKPVETKDSFIAVFDSSTNSVTPLLDRA